MAAPDHSPTTTSTRRVQVTVAIDINKSFDPNGGQAPAGAKWSIPLAIIMVGVVAILVVLVVNQRRRREGVIFFGGYERGGAERDYGLASYYASRNKAEVRKGLLDLKFWKS